MPGCMSTEVSGPESCVHVIGPDSYDSIQRVMTDGETSSGILHQRNSRDFAAEFTLENG